jgi:hypothetical protein
MLMGPERKLKTLGLEWCSAETWGLGMSGTPRIEGWLGALFLGAKQLAEPDARQWYRLGSPLIL